MCQKKVLRQNYKEHLKAHPGEDWRNTRVHGQPDNTHCFLLKASTDDVGVETGGPSTVREQERDREKRGEREVEVRSRSRSRSPVLTSHSERDLTLRRDAVVDGSSIMMLRRRVTPMNLMALIWRRAGCGRRRG